MKLLSRFFSKSYNARILSRNIVASGLSVRIAARVKLGSSVDGFYAGGRLLRDTASFVDQQAKDYVDNLERLRRALYENASVNAAVKIYCVYGKVESIGKTIPSFVLPFIC